MSNGNGVTVGPAGPGGEPQVPAAEYDVQITDTGEDYRCPEDRDLLRAMERLGRKGIPAG